MAHREASNIRSRLSRNLGIAVRSQHLFLSRRLLPPPRFPPVVPHPHVHDAEAGLIVAIFMHMRWERLALMFAILIPPVLVLVFVGLMTFEAGYTALTRGTFFVAGP